VSRVSDHGLYAAEGVVLTTLIGVFMVWLASRALERRRPGLSLARPMIIAFAARIIGAAALGLASFGSSIRGGDEPGFVFQAHFIAAMPFSSSTWLQSLIGRGTLHTAHGAITLSGSLHIFLMALQVRLFDASVLAMRATMAAISVIGLCLVATAAYELAGARAARITAWVLAFEPANIFFSTALHKEPTMYLAEGMVALGGALVWRRPRLGPVLLMVLGCLIAVATRGYAGYFLAAGSAVVLLHAAVRAASGRAGWALAMATVVVVAAIVAAPTVVQKTSHAALTEQLQNSQNANATDRSHLALEPVNFSSRSAIVVNLPRRMFDLMFRPYPWQVGDTSQRLGVIESLFVIAMLALFVRAILNRTRGLLAMAGPLIYPAFVILVAYSLAVGNAGTGFRYRTQVILMLVPMLTVMRAHARVRRKAVGPPVRPALARAAS
jgi:hypothetical protein